MSSKLISSIISLSLGIGLLYWGYNSFLKGINTLDKTTYETFKNICDNKNETIGFIKESFTEVTINNGNFYLVGYNFEVDGIKYSSSKSFDEYNQIEESIKIWYNSLAPTENSIEDPCDAIKNKTVGTQLYRLLFAIILLLIGGILTLTGVSILFSKEEY